MQKEIGSNFDLKLQYNGVCTQKINMSQYRIHGIDDAFFSKGRAAQKFVLEDILKIFPNINKTVLIPPFTCYTVIEPFTDLGFNVKSYSVDENLCVDADKLYDEIVAVDAKIVLIHKYFGFDTIKNLDSVIEKAKKSGVIFIEDLTQCLYSSFKRSNSDYYVGSFRKWAPLPDGGFAVSKSTYFTDKPQNHDATLTEKKLTAAELKYAYLHENTGEKDVFLKLFGEAEEILENETTYYSISPASAYIQENLNLTQLKDKRRKNYSCLYNLLQKKPDIKIVTPALSQDDVPLYLAISYSKRGDLQSFLAKNNIYAAIVWPKPENCPAICYEAQLLYDSILCIPIDQRYDTDDMERINTVFERFFNECN